MEQFERREPVPECEQRAGETCDTAGEHEHNELVTPGRVPERLRTRLVVADRDEHVAER